MTKENTFRVIFALVLGFVAVVGFWSPALAQDGTGGDQEATSPPPGTVNEFFRGRNGIYSSAGFDPETTMIEDAGEKGTGGFGQVRLARNPIHLVTPEDGFLPLTYVYFDLWPWQARAYDAGKLKIFYENENGGWSECSSFMVNRAVDEEGEDEGLARIACVAPMATTFGIGTDDETAVSDIIR